MQEIGASEDDARRPGVRPPAGDRLPQAAGRPLDPRHAGDRALVRSGALARLSRAQLSRPRHGGGRRRRGRARGDRRRGRAALRQLRRSGGAGAGAGALRRRHARRDARPRAGPHRARAARACRSAIDALYSLQVFTSVLGGGMSSRLFQEVREKRGLCYSIYAFHMPYADTGPVRLLCRHRRNGRARADARRDRRDRCTPTETLNDAEVARAKAQMKAGLLMALESSRRAPASSRARC